MVSGHKRAAGSSYSQGTVLNQSKRSKSNGRPKGAVLGVSCNRCRKTVQTTVFVCSCNCLFCSDCTHAHFSKSSQCPSCSRTLGQNDFMQLGIADPSTQESRAKTAFQHILTKRSSDSTHVSQRDLCRHASHSIDICRKSVSFVLKQMMKHNRNMRVGFGRLVRKLKELRAENAQLQQARNSQLIKRQQSLKDRQSQLDEMEQKVNKCKVQLTEKADNITRFKDMSRSQTPGSSNSNGSNSTGRGSREGNRTRSEGAPPLQGYLQKKEESRKHSRHNSSRPVVQGYLQKKEESRKQPMHSSSRPVVGPQFAPKPGNGGRAPSRPYSARPLGAPPRSSYEKNTGGRRASGYVSTGYSSHAASKSPVMAFSQRPRQSRHH